MYGYRSYNAISETRDEAKIEVSLANETVWLTADQMAELFQRNKSTISSHIKNIYESGELEQDRTVAFFAQVQTERTICNAQILI